MTTTTEYELVDPPADGITTTVFSPVDPSTLLVSSWDKVVKLYDVQQNQLKSSIPHPAPVLDVCFDASGSVGFSAGLDNKVTYIDLTTSQLYELGQHQEAVRCVKYSSQTGQVVSGSWDKSMCLWDSRSENPLVSKHVQPDKVFSLDIVQEKIVVAMAGRAVHIYDIRNMQEPTQKRENSLKFQTRMVKCMPNGDGYVCSSIEGRVAVEFFDPSPEWQSKKYAFKCHRKLVEGVDTIYPVNAIAFHPIHGTFASGGSDGVVNVWDGIHKKRLRQYPEYPTGISSLSFNCTGDLLAVAASYTYEQGEKDHPPDSVFIRPIAEHECRPKQV